MGYAVVREKARRLGPSFILLLPLYPIGNSSAKVLSTSKAAASRSSVLQKHPPPAEARRESLTTKEPTTKCPPGAIRTGPGVWSMAI